MLGDTSRVQLRRILETTFGVIPVVGNPTNLRMTGEGLDYSITTEASKEIRSDRQKSDMARVGASAQGPVNYELSYLEYDDLIEAALQGTWAKYGTNGVGSAFTADFTATTITASVAPTGANAFTTLQKGQWFQLIAPSNANDGKYFQVSPSVSPMSTVITVSAATPLTTGTSVANVKVSTSRLVNGVTQRSFALEKEFADVAQFFYYRGMVVSKLSMSLQSGSRITGSFDFLGKDGGRNPATAMPGVAVASQTYETMNAVAGVGNIMEGGAALTGTFIKSLSWGIDNKLRGRTAIGTLGNVGIGSGTLELSGSMDVYLADGTLYDKFVNNTDTSLTFRMTDDAGNGYIVTLPKMNYKDAKVQAGGQDQDAMITLPFEATHDETTGKTVIIDRVGAAG